MADSSVQARFVFPDSALEVCSTRFKGNKIAGLRYGRVPRGFTKTEAPVGGNPSDQF